MGKDGWQDMHVIQFSYGQNLGGSLDWFLYERSYFVILRGLRLMIQTQALPGNY